MSEPIPTAEPEMLNEPSWKEIRSEILASAEKSAAIPEIPERERRVD